VTRIKQIALLFAILGAFWSAYAEAQRIPIAIEPAAPTVLPGQSVQLQVQLSGQCPAGVKWTVNDPKHPIPSDGFISANGLYTAPAKDDVSSTSSPTVKATCKTDDYLQATVTIIINVASCLSADVNCIRLRPETAVIEVRNPKKPGKHSSRTFTLRRVPTDPHPPQWTLNKNGHGNGVIGTLFPKGESALYTAPQSVPGEQVEVEVTNPGGTSPLATSTVVLVANHVYRHCVVTALRTEPDSCRIVNFNRLRGDRGTLIFAKGTKKGVSDDTSAAWVSAVNSSKALATGSIIDLELPNGATQANCANYDWKFVTQAEESPNILIYNPSDVGSGVCFGNHFVIALPVPVLWVDVTGFVQTLDPERSAPASLANYKDCFGNNAPQSIAPCDRDTQPMVWLYRFNWIYTHFGQAGTGQGTISLPTLVGQGARQLNYDIQADPALKAGLGWINMPIMFAKNTSPGSNLNSLSISIAYDIHFLRRPNFTSSEHFSSFVVRKPQLRVASGTEIAPTSPHDVNWIQSVTVKLPLVFTGHKQPSLLTIYPVAGTEGGWHIETHLSETSAPIRGLGGGDASVRLPFTWTHNFLGGTPITLDYTYRERWLVNPEPTTNLVKNAVQTLSAGTHIFSRRTFTVPMTPNLQFQLTYLRGGLPPEFAMLGNTVSLGLTFTNPGSSEH
jgi:hypothetical protein